MANDPLNNIGFSSKPQPHHSQNSREPMAPDLVSLLKRVQKKDREAQELLLRRYENLIKRVANSVWRHNSLNDPDDLHVIAAMNLIMAAEEFDPSKCDSFEAWAKIKMRGAALRAIYKGYGIPEHLQREIHQLARTAEILSISLQRRPTIEELAATSEDTEERVCYLLLLTQTPLSLDQPSDKDSGLTVGDTIKTPEETRHDLLELIEKALPFLTKKDLAILPFILDEKSVEEISQKLSISLEAAKQRQARCKKRLKKPGLNKTENKEAI